MLLGVIVLAITYVRMSTRRPSAMGVAASVALALFAVGRSAEAHPRSKLMESFITPDSIEANDDGRAWIRSTAGRTYVLGPGDQVERQPDKSEPPWTSGEPAAGAGQPRGLSLAADGTIERDDGRAPLPEALLRAIGPKSARRAMAYDAARKRYVVLRSRRPLYGQGAWDERPSLVWFDEQRVLGEEIVPEELHGVKTAMAAAGGIVWVTFFAGVLRWDGTSWTAFGDAEVIARARDDARRDRAETIELVTAFTLGNAAASSVFALPISGIGEQRYVPTAVTTFVGSLPSSVTAAFFTVGASAGGSSFGRALSSVGLVLGVLTLPIVALATTATGELSTPSGTKEGGYLGALGGATAGALVWTLASIAIPHETFKRGWWWLLPIGASLISAASTSGYLWAGEGFRR